LSSLLIIKHVIIVIINRLVWVNNHPTSNEHIVSTIR